MGKCKFRSDWLSYQDDNGYSISSWGEKHSDSELFCKLCTCVVNVANKGLHAVLQHSQGSKHKKRCTDILGGKQLVLVKASPETSSSTSFNVSEPSKSGSSKSGLEQINTLPTRTVCLYNLKEQATIAELVWTMKSICSNYSANSSADIKATFQSMFPAGVPEQFSFSPQKLHYLATDALSVYFHNEMLADIGSSLYTISFDETTNVKDKKELQVTVTYWSDMRNQVVSRHLETIFTGKADAATLHSLISKAISNANLPLKNLVMIGSDGPNTNIKVFKLFNEEVLELRSKGLIDIGTCPIHIVHNAFLKSVDNLGEDAMNLVIAVYHYFDGWPARWEEYETIQEELNLKPHKFLKHTPTRWLSFINSGERLVEQWTGLEKYFLKYLPQKKKNDVLQKQSVKKIVDLLKKQTMLAQLHFIISSAKLFKRFTERFQTDAPLVHVLYTELQEIVLMIAGRICNTTAVREAKSSSYDWMDCKLFQFENLLPLKTVVLSEEVKTKLSQIPELDVQMFLKCVQTHYIAGAKHVIHKSMTKSASLKQALQFLNPKERKSGRSCRYIRKIATSLPIDIPDDQLVDEWKCIQTEKEPDENEINSKRVDDYWAHFMKLKREDGSLKCSLVNKVIKAALSLSHGNADSERRFSISKSYRRQDANVMSYT